MNAAPPPLPSSQPPAPSPGRMFGGVWRLTFLPFLSAKSLAIHAAILLALALLTVSGLRAPDEQALGAAYAQLTLQIYLAFAVPAIAFLFSGGAIREDMSSITGDYVLTRPVRRPVLLLMRFASQVICLQLLGLTAFAVLVACGACRDVPGLATTASSLLLAQTLAIPAFSALGFAFGSLTGRYLVLGIVYGGIVELGIGNIPTRISGLSMSHQVRILAGQARSLQEGGQSAGGAFTAAMLLAGLTLFFVALAAVSFSLQEYTGSRPKDS